MASSPNNQSGWTERIKMLLPIKTKHDGVFLYLQANANGLILTLSKDKTIKWKPEAFPLSFYLAVNKVLKGEEVSVNFNATLDGSFDVCGTVEYLPDDSVDESFFKLTLCRHPMDENTLSIKLRRTELQAIGVYFVDYWTC